MNDSCPIHSGQWCSCPMPVEEKVRKLIEAHGSEVLTEHIRTCQSHPLGKSECQHDQIQTWRSEEGQPLMWACAACLLRFYPSDEEKTDAERLSEFD